MNKKVCLVGPWIEHICYQDVRNHGHQKPLCCWCVLNINFNAIFFLFCFNGQHSSSCTSSNIKGLNPLSTKLNPICHMLALLGAHHILHVGRIRVKDTVLCSMYGTDPRFLDLLGVTRYCVRARAGLWVGRTGHLPRALTSRGRRKGSHRPATC
jgi:hypothetical protein